MNLFNRANTFWKENKDKVKWVGQETQPQDGRPKWMRDSPEFSDDVKPTPAPAKKAPQRKFEDAPPEPPRSNSGGSQKAAPKPSKPTAADLFDSSERTPYVSPYRRGGKKPATDTPPSRTPPPPKPEPVQLRQRTFTPAPPGAEPAARKHRETGTEHFKLGRFAESESCYSSAISLLPSGHASLIPLHNNRAAARLKVGDWKGAVEDVTLVIDIVGPDFDITKEDSNATYRSDTGDLADALVKSLSRRAAAYEMGDKWDVARKDWEFLLGIGSRCGGAGARMNAEAARGVNRCKKMLDVVERGQDEAPKPAPKPRPPPPRANSNKPLPTGKALQSLREANAQQANEDDQRAALKDTVDAKLQAWRGGKEDNIRALLGSLDLILWEELGWKKAGLADLVGEAQVKRVYLRAIGKVHPDKLKVGNTSLEHRMIANGVFGTLNEAWNVFKP
jgi:tetratricopeptide (TPR) repeat protein